MKGSIIALFRGIEIATSVKEDDKGIVKFGKELVRVAASNAELADRLFPEELLATGRSKASYSQQGHYSVTVLPVNDYGGSQVRIIAFSHDISDQLVPLARLRWSLMVATGRPCPTLLAVCATDHQG